MTDTTADEHGEATAEAEANTVETEEQNAALAEGQEEVTEGEQHADPKLSKARKEAAGYRERLRTAEGSLTSAQQRAEGFQKRLIAQEVSQHQVSADALFAAGYTLDDLTDADGLPDAGKVADAAKSAREKFSLQRFQGGGDGGARAEQKQPKQAEWGSLFDKSGSRQ